MAIQYRNARVGDVRTAISVTFTQENEAGVSTAVNITGLAVTVKVVNGATGAVVVAATATGVTVTDAVNGEVDYQLPDAAVANAGIFWMSFIVTQTGFTDTFPVLHNDFQLRVCSDSQSAQAAYDAALTS